MLSSEGVSPNDDGQRANGPFGVPGGGLLRARVAFRGESRRKRAARRCSGSAVLCTGKFVLYGEVSRLCARGDCPRAVLETVLPFWRSLALCPLGDALCAFPSQNTLRKCARPRLASRRDLHVILARRPHPGRHPTRPSSRPGAEFLNRRTVALLLLALAVTVRQRACLCAISCAVVFVTVLCARVPFCDTDPKTTALCVCYVPTFS